jgi:hypothetical protein
MRIYSLYIFISILLLSGCTFLSRKIESLENKDYLQNNFNSSLTSKNKTLYCFENSYEQYYLEDDVTQNFYVQNFVNANIKTNFIQKSILLSFYEMLRRPDTSGPFSRLQVYIRTEKDYYFDFRPSDLSDINSMPYIYGLEKIHDTFEKKDTFRKFLKKYISSFNLNLPVSSEFELFLKKHKNEIIKDENLIQPRPFFFFIYFFVDKIVLIF